MKLNEYTTGKLYSNRNFMKSPEQRLQEADALCKQQGIRLTPLRETLLKLMYLNPAPLSAYELLRLLRQTHPQAEAMTVYRILHFLENHHLVHRITSCNTYAACLTPEHPHQPQLLICERCGSSTEIEEKSLAQAVKKVLELHNFQSSSKPTEIFGICGVCHPAA